MTKFDVVSLPPRVVEVNSLTALLPNSATNCVKSVQKRVQKGDLEMEYTHFFL